MINIKNILFLLLAFIVPFMVMGSSAAIGKGVYTIITLALFLLTICVLLLIGFADYIIVPLFTAALHITVQPYPGYKVTPGMNAVIKNVNELHYATGYLTANLFSYTFKQESVPEEEDYRLSQAPDAWERLIMNIRFPFKFHVVSSGVNVQTEREDLEGKRAYHEFELNKAQQSSSVNESIIAEIRRKIRVIEAHMNRLSAGEKPVMALMYVETTAVGTTEKAALDTLAAQLNELQVAFSSMDLSVNRVVGRELFALHGMDFSLPTSAESLEEIFDRQE